MSAGSEFQTRSRIFQQGPQIAFLLVDKVGVIGGSFWDIPVVCPFPCNTFFLASVRGGDESNSLLMYFAPLNKPRGFAFTSLNGTEQVFYLNESNITAGPVYRSVITFKDPVLNFFVAIGSENGNLSRYTIACTNDDQLRLSGGVYT